MEKIRWGVLSTAKIGLQKVIPGFQKSERCEVAAIASRSEEKAEVAALSLGIPRSYGSYEAMLNDPDLDAVYIPLPNSMHLEWSVRTMEAGKHLLCEKPVALTIGEVEEMIRVRDRCGVMAGEAFMVKSTPWWIETRERIRRGEVGEMKLMQGMFSYYNDDPGNIRNIPELGGGGMWDIGCYCVTMSRYLFEDEPLRVVAKLEYDPEMKTDRLGSVIMEFASGQCIFAVSTQLAGYQRMHVHGTAGHLEVRIPFNAPVDRPCQVAQDSGTVLLDEITTHTYPVLDQYALMGDAFSLAIAEGGEVPVSLEDALLNTRVLTAIFESARTGKWIDL